MRSHEAAMESTGRITRRTFVKLAAGAAASGAAGAELLAAPVKKLEPLPPGIKVSLQISTDATDEDLQFAQQLGVDYVNIPTGGARATLENFIPLKKKVEAAGLKVWNIGNSNVHNMPEVTLNLPGRDQKIEEYKNFLRNLAKAGIFYTTYAHMGNGIWSSANARPLAAERRRAPSTWKKPKGCWVGKVFEGPLTHGRKFTKKSSGRTTPTSSSRSCRWPKSWVCASASIRTIRRCRNWAACRAASSATSTATCAPWKSPTVRTSASASAREPGWKAASTWARTSSKPPAPSRKWTSSGRFTSATSARPFRYFVETFVDNGYTDMLKLMKTLHEVDFRGAVIADHVPDMVGGRKTGWAYSIGYIKALLNAANAEAKRDSSFFEYNPACLNEPDTKQGVNTVAVRLYRIQPAKLCGLYPVGKT